MDGTGLTARWAGAWGDCRPVSYELRSCLHDRWVRFQSLPGEETWTHLWVSAARLHDKELPRLPRLVADDVTAGVIITTAEMDWLYAPYDGGVDVIAASPAHRDQLRRAHSDWLSAHPAGL